MKFCPPRNFWLATPLSKNHSFKSIINFFLVVNQFRCNKVDILANHLFYHFWQTIVFVIFAGGPVLILVPGPGLALNGPVGYSFTLFFAHFLSENIMNKLLLAKPTVLENISCFKRIIIIIWLTKYGINRGGC